MRMPLSRVDGFQRRGDRRLARCHLEPGTVVVSDTLGCFGAVRHAGCFEPAEGQCLSTPHGAQSGTNRSNNMTSNLIVHRGDNIWPFERFKFAPDTPEEVPTETLQWVEYFPDDAEEQRKPVRYVVRSKWLLITHNPHPVRSPSRKATRWDRKRLLNRFESGTKRRAGRQISAERLRCSSNMSFVRNQEMARSRIEIAYRIPCERPETLA